MAESRPLRILGIPIAPVTPETARKQIGDWLQAPDARKYICVTGTHGILESRRDHAVRTAHLDADMCVPDGMPLVWLGWLRGFRDMDRVYGPDLMRSVCYASVKEGWTHYLLGGAPGVAEDLKTVLEKQYPGIRVVGTFTPPFRPLTDSEFADLAADVARAEPHLLWIGLSTPKQELFMHQYRDRLNARIMIGVGAAFDILSGRTKDAPQWIKHSGFQWLFRLCQEPRRLGRRYLWIVPTFLILSLLELTGLLRSPGSEGRPHP